MLTLGQMMNGTCLFLLFHLLLASEPTGNFIVRLVSLDKALEQLHITDHLLTEHITEHLVKC